MAAGNTTTKNTASGRILKGAVGALLLLALLAPLGGATGFRATASDASAAPVSSLVLTPPAGTQPWDVMLATIAIRGACASIAVPSGWNAADIGCQATTGLANAVYWRTFEEGDGASTWTFSTPVVAAGAIVSYAGVDAFDPIAADGSATEGPSFQPTAPAITTTQANQRVVGFFATAAETTFSPPPGMTERVDRKSTTGVSSTGVTIEVADYNQATAVTTGPKDATAGSSAMSVSHLVALRLPTVQFSAASSSAAEDEVPAMTVELSSPSSLDTTVTFSAGTTGLTGATASGGDYSSAGTLTIPAGQPLWADLPVTIVDDAADELSERVKFTLTGATNAVVATAAADKEHVLTITDDDDPVITVVATDNVATEAGLTTGTFTVSRPAAQNQLAITVNYVLSGNATLTSDYAVLPNTPGTLALGAGVTSAAITVTPVHDANVEPTEAVNITLTAVTAGNPYTVGLSADASINLLDDDSPLPTITVVAGDATATETLVNPLAPQTDTGTFTVMRSGSTANEVNVPYTITGTAGQPGTGPSNQYQLSGTSGVAKVLAGQSSATITVTPNDDAAAEAIQTVILTLNTYSGTDFRTGSPQSAQVNLVSNDGPTLSVADVSQAEGDFTPENVATVTVTLSAPSPDPVKVHYATSTTAGQAVAGTDFTSTSQDLTFDALATTATFTVQLAPDQVVEPDETFVVTLSDPHFAQIGDGTATVTISNDDKPAVSFRYAQSTGTEGAALPVEVTINPPLTSGSATVNYAATTSGTANVGADFTAASGSLVFGVGEASKSFNLDLVDDNTDELTESFEATLSVVGATVRLGENSSASILIVDNDDPSFAVAATDAANEQALTVGNFTITRVGSASRALTVAYGITGGSATSGTDYAAPAGTVSFASGQTTAKVAVTPLQDAVDEPTETIVLTLSDGAAYNLTSPSAASMDLLDNDDPTVTIAATDAAAAEAGPGEGTFTITRSGSLVLGQVVGLARGGTATAADHAALPATVTFAAGETTKTVTVTPVDDAVDEPAETVVLTVAAGSGYVVGTPSSGTVTIADDDLPTVTVTAADGIGSEPSGDNATFLVTRTVGDPSAPLVVAYEVGGTAAPGADYVALSGTVTIDAGNSSANVTVDVSDDAFDEDAETVSLMLAAAPVAYVNGTLLPVSVSIIDDDAMPIVGFNATTSSAGESAGTLEIEVGLSEPSSKPVTVEYFAGGGTAIIGGFGDFLLPPGTLTFAPGEVGKTITVTLTDDALDEANEYREVLLGLDVANATLGVATHNFTIVDDDDAPEVSFDANTSMAGEDAGAVTFDVTLSGPSGKAVTVAYAVTGGNADAHDLVLAAGNLTFPAGTTTLQVMGNVTDDAFDEPAENAVLTLSGPSNATLGLFAEHTLTITDDDDALVNITTAAHGTEAGPAYGQFTVTRTPTGDLSAPLVVSYFVDAGNSTATEGSDFEAPSGSVTIEAGNSTAPIFVTVLDDALDEDAETVRIDLAPGSGYGITWTSLAVFVIADDDDAPEVAFDDPASSGAESSSPANLTVSLSAPSGLDVLVHYAVTGGSASDSDRTLAEGDLVFAPGETSKTIALAITGDAIDEDAETVNVTLSAPTNATLVGVVEHVYTIVDDDAGPTVAFYQANATTPEDTAMGNLNLTVALSGPSSRTVTVELAITGGTATPGDDFDLATGTLTFTPGQTHKSVAVTGLADALDEDAETLQATLSSPSNATLGAIPVHTLTIVDDDATPTVAWRTSTSGTGENSTTLVWADLSAVSGRAATVNYTVAAGTAGAGDFTAATGTLTFPAGNASQPISIVSAADALDEPDETVTVTLSGPSNLAVGTPAVHTHTIADDDSPPTVAFASAASSGGEGSTPALLTVDLSGASGKTVTVAYTAANGTAGSADYTLPSGNLTFAPGETSKDISAAILADAVDEANETFTVTLAGPANATLGATAVHTRTITDEDDAPTVSFETVTSSSGEGAASTVSFDVTSTDSTEQSVTVDYAITGGSAVNGTDYVLASGTLTFGPTETVRTITASILDDIADEPDETFTVTLSHPVNAVLGANKTHTHTLLDDDSASSTVSLRASDTSASEAGPATGAFTVSRTGNLAVPITVQYTVGGTATPGSDYIALSGSVALGAGVASATVLVTPVNDALNEGSQTVVATVVASHGYTLGTAKTGTVTIADNDPLPKVAFVAAAGSEDEAAGTIDVNVTLSAPSGRQVTVKYITSGLTAKSPGDYTGTGSGMLTFAAGETTKTVSIPLIDDGTDEANETFRITLSSPVNAVLGTATVFTATILDDDAAPTVEFQVADSTAVESGSKLVSVRLSEVSGKTVTVRFATSNGDAEAGLDYTALSGTVTIAPGTLSKTISVSIRSDAITEGDEAFFVTLDTPVNAVLGTDVHTVTIVDND